MKNVYTIRKKNETSDIVEYINSDWNCFRLQRYIDSVMVVMIKGVYWFTRNEFATFLRNNRNN